SVKGAKQFAKAFADVLAIISQDDKSKIGIGILTVSKTFYTLQSITEPVRVADHDFPCGNNQ
ncbi:9530_t:CDS:1, partial [Scutellospora calospora]